MELCCEVKALQEEFRRLYNIRNDEKEVDRVFCEKMSLFKSLNLHL